MKSVQGHILKFRSGFSAPFNVILDSVSGQVCHPVTTWVDFSAMLIGFCRDNIYLCDMWKHSHCVDAAQTVPSSSKKFHICLDFSLLGDFPGKKTNIFWKDIESTDFWNIAYIIDPFFSPFEYWLTGKKGQNGEKKPKRFLHL